jgi:hypothetical protein
MRSAWDASGSTLVEALIATLILSTGLVAMAHLIAMATASNVAARHETVAQILAAQKVEELLADVAGGGPQPASPWSLQRDTPGFVDYVDEQGAAAGAAALPVSMLYTRRWSIEPLAPTAAGAQPVLIQVLVTRRRNRGRADLGMVDRLPGEARFMTVWAAP